MYVRSKIIKGQTYYYLVEGRRSGQTVRQKVIKYLGKSAPARLYSSGDSGILSPEDQNPMLQPPLPFEKLKKHPQFEDNMRVVEVEFPMKDFYARSITYPEYRDHRSTQAGRKIRHPILISVRQTTDLTITDLQVHDGWHRVRQAIANRDEFIPAKLVVDRKLYEEFLAAHTVES